MASGVETEKGLAAVLLEAPVHAVLVTRQLKRAPGDLFLRTGSGRAKKHVLPHHVVNAATAMVTGTPKDAVTNAKTFGALTASKLEISARDNIQSYGDGAPFSERVVKRDLYAPGVPSELINDILPQLPEGQSLLDAILTILSELADLSEVQDLRLGLNPQEPYKSDIKVWLTTRPVRRATIVHRVDDKCTVECIFTSIQPEMTKSLDGFVEHGRSSYEVIGWSALVEMARLAHAEPDRKSLPCPNPNPFSAEDGEGDTKTSATEKTEAVEAPPSTASGILEPLTDQLQAPQQVGHPAYTLSLSPREEVGTLDVSAGLWGGQSPDKQGLPSHEHASSYPARSAVA